MAKGRNLHSSERGDLSKIQESLLPWMATIDATRQNNSQVFLNARKIYLTNTCYEIYVVNGYTWDRRCVQSINSWILKKMPIS